MILGLLPDVLPRDRLGYDFKLPWLLLFIASSALTVAQVARHVSEPTNAALRRRCLGVFGSVRVKTRDAHTASKASPAG